MITFELNHYLILYWLLVIISYCNTLYIIIDTNLCGSGPTESFSDRSAPCLQLTCIMDPCLSCRRPAVILHQTLPYVLPIHHLTVGSPSPFWAPSSSRTSSGSWTSAPSPRKHSRECTSCDSWRSSCQSQWWFTSTPPSLRQIVADPSHPRNKVLEPLPSGRRLQSIRTKTLCYKNSFFTTAPGPINKTWDPYWHRLLSPWFLFLGMWTLCNMWLFC